MSPTTVAAPSLSRMPEPSYPNPGYLGPSSLKAVLSELEGHDAFPSQSRTDSVTVPAHAESPGGAYHNSLFGITRALDIEEGAKVLGLLINSLHADTLRWLFRDWYGHGFEEHLGSGFAKHFVESIASEMEAIAASRDISAGLNRLSRRIFDNGNKQVEIDADMTMSEFCQHCTGPNVRWETVGIIITFIG